MNREQLIETLARAEAIRDHPVTSQVSRSIITELCETVRALVQEIEESDAQEREEAAA